MIEAVADQRLVYKLAAVINIQRTKRKGQCLANAFERLNDQTTLTNHQWRSLRPTAGNVRQHKAIDVAAAVGN